MTGDGGELASLAVVASAVVARRIAVSAAAVDRTYTDGVTTIYVAPQAERRDVRASVVVQSALIAAGSLEGSQIGRLKLRRAVADRYLTLEAIRACHVLGMSVPRWLAETLAGWYRAPVSESVEDSVRRACDNTEPIPDPPPWFGVIRPAKLAAGHWRLHDSGVSSAFKAAEVGEDDPDRSETDSDGSSSVLRSPLTSNVVMALLRRLFGGGATSAASGKGTGGDVAFAVARCGLVDDDAPRSAASSGTGSPIRLSPPVGLWYPEWDWTTRGFRDRWCAVAEFDAPVDTPRAAQDPCRHRLLRRELAKLSTRYRQRRRTEDGETLDMTGLVDFVASRAAGVLIEPRVYKGVQRSSGDVGVLVLLDATSSTGGTAGDRDTFAEQRGLADTLTSALHALGERVALFAFNSAGRTNVRLLRVKGFDDEYDHRSRSRLAGLRPMGYTRLGAALRRASDVLATRAGTANQLLVVVSDGVPYDDGYEGVYAREDSRHAVDEAFERGIGCVAVSVAADEPPEHLDQVWGKAPHARLTNADAAGEHILPLFLTALRRAATLASMNRS